MCLLGFNSRDRRRLHRLRLKGLEGLRGRHHSGHEILNPVCNDADEALVKAFRACLLQKLLETLAARQFGDELPQNGRGTVSFLRCAHSFLLL